MSHSGEAEKINVKVHKNCLNIGKTPKIARVRCHFANIEIEFSRHPMRYFIWCYYRQLITSIVLEKCKKEWNML